MYIIRRNGHLEAFIITLEGAARRKTGWVEGFPPSRRGVLAGLGQGRSDVLLDLQISCTHVESCHCGTVLLTNLQCPNGPYTSDGFKES
jgi:hypothetical protein